MIHCVTSLHPIVDYFPTTSPTQVFYSLVKQAGQSTPTLLIASVNAGWNLTISWVK